MGKLKAEPRRCPSCGHKNPSFYRVPDNCLFCSEKAKAFNLFVRGLKKKRRGYGRANESS